MKLPIQPVPFYVGHRRSFFNYHLLDGHFKYDESIVVSAREHPRRAFSTFRVKTGYMDWERARLLAEELIELYNSRSPPNSLPAWTVDAIFSALPVRAKVFLGDIPLVNFLSWFPRTFELFGGQYLRLRGVSTMRLVDSCAEFLRNVSLAEKFNFPVTLESICCF
jgi:hypothetical protein